MPDISISINMINETLLTRQDVHTPFEPIPHVDINFDLWAGKFGRLEGTGFRVSGEQGAEDGEVRTLGVVEDPPDQAVARAERLRGRTRETLLRFRAPAYGDQKDI